MTGTDPFDVAISFVNDDLGFATELRDSLGEALDVFIYTKKQEDLAGTDGLKSFRDVFRSGSRLVVILVRERWGETDWTRVEEQAITDRFLKEGPDFLFVVMMDESPPPPWLPDKLIRFSLRDFGLKEAVGAIKARALERGSALRRPSAGFLADRARSRAQFGERRTGLLRSAAGVQQAKAEAKALVQLISARANEALLVAPDIGIEFGAQDAYCVMKTPGVAVTCSYQNNIVNVLDEARLLIMQFRGGVLLPGQSGCYRQEPKELQKTIYTPDLSQETGWVWKAKSNEFLSSEQLANAYIEQFFDLLDRQSAGKLPRIDWG